MRVNTKSVPAIILGFVAGVVFLISCSSGSNSPVGEVDASVPQTTDQMVCKAWVDNWFVAGTGPGEVEKNVECQLQSETTTTKRYTTLSSILSDGWTVISAGGSYTTFMVFYK